MLLCLLLNSTLDAQYSDGDILQMANIVDIPLVARILELSCARVVSSDFGLVSSVATTLVAVSIITLASAFGDSANNNASSIGVMNISFIILSFSKNLRGL